MKAQHYVYRTAESQIYIQDSGDKIHFTAANEKGRVTLLLKDQNQILQFADLISSAVNSKNSDGINQIVMGVLDGAKSHTRWAMPI